MPDLRLRDMHPGLSRQFQVLVTEAMLDGFAALSGDTSPLHMDRDYARSCGQPDRLAHGMLTASFYSTLVGVHLPGKNALLQGLDVSFNKPVHPGDVLDIIGEVRHVSGAARQIEIKAQISNQRGEKVSKATIKVGLRAE